MEDGIYQVRLSSGEDCVEGMVTIRDNVINGGGGGYYCRGMISKVEKVLSGSVMRKIGITKRIMPWVYSRKCLWW